MIKKVTAIFIFTYLYAIIRYNVFGEVSWNQLPSYISNKAIAWSAVVFLLITGWHHFKKNHAATTAWGRLAFHFSVVHIFLSLMLFSEPYYAKFFSGAHLSFSGELMILSGVLAAYTMYRIKRSKMQDSASTRFELLTIAAVGIHLFSMGLPGWLEPTQWYGSLPPVSLWSFFTVLAAGFLYIVSPKSEEEQI